MTRWLGLLWLCLLACGQALAQAADAASAPPPLASLAGQPGSAAMQPPANIVVMNREIITLRGSLFGIPAVTRANEGEERIRKALRRGGELKVQNTAIAEGVLVSIDNALMFAVTPEDSEERTLAGARASADAAAVVLQRVIDESRESRNLKSLLVGAAVTLGTGLLMLGLMWLLRWLQLRAQAWMTRRTLAAAERLKVGGVELVRREGLLRFEQWLLNVVFWSLTLLLVYEWLSISLAQFPFTRPWGEQLNDFLFGMLSRFALAILHAIPDLLAAALIFWLAWLLTHVLRGFFVKVGAGQVRLSWLDADVASITSKLCIGAVWLFALAMAYPYLPGSDTEAFKGLSVLVGLMLSLGASNLVGQLASGTDQIRFLNPATLAETGRIKVTFRGQPLRNLNELEWVKGEIWANVWQTDMIVRINPATGVVVGRINLTGLLGDADRRGASPDVLNGIAYDAKGDRLFVTGKQWSKLYEIKLVEVVAR